jgi:hypothetical protein
VGQDATERKQAELEMTRVTRQLQTFIDTANALILGTDSPQRGGTWVDMLLE